MVESPDREAKASYKVKIQARILADEEDKAVVEKLGFVHDRVGEHTERVRFYSATV